MSDTPTTPTSTVSTPKPLLKGFTLCPIHNHSYRGKLCVLCATEKAKGLAPGTIEGIRGEHWQDTDGNVIPTPVDTAGWGK